MGKIPTGLAEGKAHWIGSYEYCQDLKINYTYKPFYNESVPGEKREYNGRYCRIDLRPAV